MPLLEDRYLPLLILKFSVKCSTQDIDCTLFSFFFSSTVTSELSLTRPLRNVSLHPPLNSSCCGRQTDRPASRLELNLKLVVLGAGTSMGKFIVQIARIAGFDMIVAIASLSSLKDPKSYGATHFIDRHSPDIVAQVLEELLMISSM